MKKVVAYLLFILVVPVFMLLVLAYNGLEEEGHDGAIVILFAVPAAILQIAYWYFILFVL